MRTNSPDLWSLPSPGDDGHKYDRGHVLVLSGGVERAGASRLAAWSALRVGAGLVTLAAPPAALAAHAAQVTSVMLVRWNEAGDLVDLQRDDRINAIAAGPGLGGPNEPPTRIVAAVRMLLERASEGRALVLDADALTAFEHEPQSLFDAIARGMAAAVLTPHEGEFARLFGERGTTDAARASGAVVVRKGACTEIAAPDGRAVRNDHASPHLATAGSGDVLTGLIAGLAAQGMEPFDAACAAVWMHGEAGRRGGPGLVSSDLPGLVPGVLRDL